MFAKYKTTKELWVVLEKEYATKDVGTKKSAVEKFLDFQMEEGKSMITQVRNFWKIIHEVQTEGMNIPKQFVVAGTIHKLPPSYKDFEISLKHKKNEMKMEDLIVRLRIQEQHRENDSKNKEKPKPKTPQRHK